MTSKEGLGMGWLNTDPRSQAALTGAATEINIRLQNGRRADGRLEDGRWADGRGESWMDGQTAGSSGMCNTRGYFNFVVSRIVLKEGRKERRGGGRKRWVSQDSPSLQDSGHRT